MGHLLSDTSKFTLLQEDPTLRNLSTVQSYSIPYIKEMK